MPKSERCLIPPRKRYQKPSQASSHAPRFSPARLCRLERYYDRMSRPTACPASTSRAYLGSDAAFQHISQFMQVFQVGLFSSNSSGPARPSSRPRFHQSWKPRPARREPAPRCPESTSCRGRAQCPAAKMRAVGRIPLSRHPRTREGTEPSARGCCRI